MKQSITFDTLEYMDELKKSGLDQEKAEAITKATARAFSQMIENNHLATREDLQELKMDLYAFIVKAVTTVIGILGGLQVLFHFIK